MATGNYGDIKAKRRVSEAAARKEMSYVKEEYGRMTNGGAQMKDVRGRVKIRQIDTIGRGVVESGYRSSSSLSDPRNAGGRSQREGSITKATDKEPGELSSESGSDDGPDSEAHAKEKGVSKPNEPTKLDDVVQVPTGKKRKFSPIVWDRDDKDFGKNLNNGVTSSAALLPPPPPRPKILQRTPDISSRNVIDIPPPPPDNLRRTPGISPHNVVDMSSPPPKSLPPTPDILSHDVVVVPPPNLEYDKLHISKSSPVMALEELCKENGKFSTDANMPSFPHHQNQLNVDPDAVHSEDDDLTPMQRQSWSINHEAADDDFVPARNISSSRWADKVGSPRDVGEIADDLGPRKRRKQTPCSESYEGNFSGISSTPGEGKRGFDSEDNKKKSNPSCDDHFAVTESEKCNMMDSDAENDHGGSFSGNSDSDPEDQDDLHGNQDAPALHVRSVNMLQACRSVDEFERLNKIDEGTYGVVYRARDKKSGEIVALKKIKMEREREGFPLTSLREINILLSFHHPSIVDVKEVVVGTSLDSIFMVMEYMEHDLKGLMETMKQPYSQSEVKCLMIQLLEGVKYLHDNWVLHRDLKTSNLLLNNRGELKICDFGLSRQYGSPLKPYTQLVVTLWYRAPELLLGAKQYSTAIDMWSLGCIMAELLSKKPLFDGKTEFEQLDKIFRTLGTPSESIWSGFSKLPGVKVNFVKHQYNLLRKKFPATSFTGSPVLSDAGFDLLNKLLTYDPDKRITAEEALSHDWFREVPLPKSKDFMPTFPAQHAQDRRMRRIMKSPDPLEELRRKELQQGADLGTRGLFG